MSVSAALPLLPVGIELGGSALCLAEVRKAMIFKHRAHETHSYGNLHQRLIQQLVTGVIPVQRESLVSGNGVFNSSLSASKH